MNMKINVDPLHLENSASHIEMQIADYEKTYRQLFQVVEGMKNGWQGKDNQAFVTQISGFEQDFIKMRDVMRDYAQFLKFSAKLYRDTQNDRIAQARRLAN